jgi:PAS domain-containing protein
VDSLQWRERIHPDDRRQALALRERAVATGDPYVADYRFKRKDGGFVDIAERGSFTMDPGIPEARPITPPGRQADLF